MAYGLTGNGRGFSWLIAQRILTVRKWRPTFPPFGVILLPIPEYFTPVFPIEITTGGTRAFRATACARDRAWPVGPWLAAYRFSRSVSPRSGGDPRGKFACAAGRAADGCGPK